MNKKIFTAKTLDECLDMATSQLKIKKEEIKYEIIECKKGLFNKKVSISVGIEGSIEENRNGTIKVKDGKIIVENPKEGGIPAFIKPFKKARVVVNQNEIKSKIEVLQDTIIEIIFESNRAERRLNISITQDNMEAYVSIKYIPENTYILKDTEESNELDIEIEVKEQVFPQAYTKTEILEQLTLSGIKYGIKEDVLVKLTEQQDFDNILVAEGIPAINGIDDKIEIKFSEKTNSKKLVEDEEGKVDYKSIGRVESSRKGDILVVRREGKEGKDGIDVKGIPKKHKVLKKVQLKAGEGCELRGENIAVALIEGKPSCKGNVISVHKLHVIDNDVDLKTGNIDFVGDVVIYGNVKEGMKVNAGHNLIIHQNVESAIVNAKGDLEVTGNIINSHVSAGGTDINKLNKVKNLEKLYSFISQLIITVDHIKKFSLLGKKVHDGEVVKVLIENKFKGIIPTGTHFMASVLKEDSDEEINLSNTIKEKLIGFAPLNIKTSDELRLLMNQIEEVKTKLSGELSEPVDIKMNYCQDSTINSSGNIIVVGKGEYVSHLTAYESIEFINPNSLVRGGVIKAGKDIKCKHVGSEGGVSTKLIVEASGNISVDVAYQNTCFRVGEREYVLECPSKNVHAYLNNEGELIVDKFIL